MGKIKKRNKKEKEKTLLGKFRAATTSVSPGVDVRVAPEFDQPMQAIFPHDRSPDFDVERNGPELCSMVETYFAEHGINLGWALTNISKTLSAYQGGENWDLSFTGFTKRGEFGNPTGSITSGVDRLRRELVIVRETNALLERKLEARPAEDPLIERLRMKMRCEYGPKNRDMLEDFMCWLVDSGIIKREPIPNEYAELIVSQFIDNNNKASQEHAGDARLKGEATNSDKEK